MIYEQGCLRVREDYIVISNMLGLSEEPRVRVNEFRTSFARTCEPPVWRLVFSLFTVSKCFMGRSVIALVIHEAYLISFSRRVRFLTWVWMFILWTNPVSRSSDDDWLLERWKVRVMSSLDSPTSNYIK